MFFGKKRLIILLGICGFLDLVVNHSENYNSVNVLYKKDSVDFLIWFCGQMWLTSRSALSFCSYLNFPAILNVRFCFVTHNTILILCIEFEMAKPKLHYVWSISNLWLSETYQTFENIDAIKAIKLLSLVHVNHVLCYWQFFKCKLVL